MLWRVIPEIKGIAIQRYVIILLTYLRQSTEYRLACRYSAADSLDGREKTLIRAD